MKENIKCVFDSMVTHFAMLAVGCCLCVMAGMVNLAMVGVYHFVSCIAAVIFVGWLVWSGYVVVTGRCSGRPSGVSLKTLNYSEGFLFLAWLIVCNLSLNRGLGLAAIALASVVFVGCVVVVILRKGR